MPGAGGGPAPRIEAPEGASRRSLLRFMTCGSVDDGKSTLLGRLLHDCGAIPEDQLDALRADSVRAGTQRGELDLALALDGLSAEREQGITIDVAYRYFSSAKRAFIVADAPGHEQYTRNMATAASTADLAILLVDVRKGLLPQTRRHSIIARLMGIRHILLAVNKMDLVGYDRGAFEAVVADFRSFAEAAALEDFNGIPLSSLKGDNVVRRSSAMVWYEGPTLIERLDEVEIEQDRERATSFRMPVQWVNRPNPDFRGFSGTISSGVLRPGDAVVLLPGNRASQIERIVTFDGDLDEAGAGESVTLTLADPLDCSRGDVIAAASDPPEVADQFETTIIWMSDQPMLPGRRYWLKQGTRSCTAEIQQLKYQLNVNTMEHVAARTLEENAVGVATLSTDRPLVFEPYEVNRDLGGFILIDKLDNRTVGAGMLHFALRRSHNVRWQAIDVTREQRADIKQQRPIVLWLTGLSGAGKSTIANLVDRKLTALGRHTFLLDGDNLRHGLNRDLGFTDADRVENVRRVGQVARLMADAGLIVIVALISPFRAERRMVREMMPRGEFAEIHVDVPLAVAEQRDVKGLYARARAGELSNFTGIDSPYESPEQPEIRIDASAMPAEEAADLIVSYALGR